MKLIFAPDSFKGSLSAQKICNVLQRVAGTVMPNVEFESIPLADGGEGTVEALVSATKGKLLEHRVSDPLGRPITAQYGILGNENTAVIEMAAASGLPSLSGDEKNPLKTTTFGSGELIRHATEQNVDKIIMGIGGSATTDCGTGMAQALGVRFFDQRGDEVNQPMNGERMGAVKSIDLSGCIHTPPIVVACDVSNPLLGKSGAVYVYAPQKGAVAGQLPFLEKNMSHIIDIIEKAVDKKVRDNAGAGAAGGLGAGLMAFLDAQLFAGVDLVLDACHFVDRIRDADFIITGEGEIDAQTLHGKTISGVLERAQKLGVPVIAIAGKVDHDLQDLYNNGLLSAFSICSGPMTLEQSIHYAEKLVQSCGERIFRVLNTAKIQSSL